MSHTITGTADKTGREGDGKIDRGFNEPHSSAGHSKAERFKKKSNHASDHSSDGGNVGGFFQMHKKLKFIWSQQLCWI